MNMGSTSGPWRWSGQRDVWRSTPIRPAMNMGSTSRFMAVLVGPSRRVEALDAEFVASC